MASKFYQNPQRAAAEAAASKPYQPYMPQYRIHGIEPDQTYAMADRGRTTNSHQAMLIRGNPNMFGNATATHISRNVPFAEIPKASARENNMPNIGNNMENTWAATDGIIDDIGLNHDSNAQMIDNNDFIDLNSIAQTHVSVPMITSGVVPMQNMSNTSLPVTLQDDEYLLAVGDNIIATGPMEFIEQEVKDLIFGDHQLCEGKAIPADELMVLKRVKIKVGVFING